MGCNFDSSYIENNNKNIFEEINSSVMDIKFEKNDIRIWQMENILLFQK